MEDMRVASLKDRIRAWFYNTSNKIGNRLVDGQTAITNRMAERVQIPEGKLWGVWPSGADIELFARSKSKRHWPSEGEPIRLIYIGVLHIERNLMSLAKATVAAVAEGMNFQLTLTGSGTEQENLKRFADTTQGIVEVHSPIPHDQVPDHLAESHVGVLPFPDEEKYRVSSPIKLFEYMASGMAILATRIVCHTDVVQNNAYIFWADGPSVDDLLSSLRSIWSARTSLPAMGEQAVQSRHPDVGQALHRNDHGLVHLVTDDDAFTGCDNFVTHGRYPLAGPLFLNPESARPQDGVDSRDCLTVLVHALGVLDLSGSQPESQIEQTLHDVRLAKFKLGVGGVPQLAQKVRGGLGIIRHGYSSSRDTIFAAIGNL
jgi:hypothetical protein